MGKRLVFVLIMILLIGGVIGAFTSTSEAETKADWKTEIVNGNFGAHTSLEIDREGDPHISFFDEKSSDLMYSEWTGSGWTNETVDSVRNVGKYTSLALDNSGDPHVSYYYNTDRDLKYASKTGGNWVVETVESSGDVGGHTSLVLDEDDHPHISYLDYTLTDLKYAEWTGSSWQIERVRNYTGIEGEFSSIALDSDGDPHISFYNKAKTSLEYATKTGSTWEVETVDHPDLQEVGEHSSLALDSSDDPHIVYEGYYPGKLKYAGKSDGDWINYTIDSSEDTGYHPSIAVDEDDTLHVAYLDYEDRELKYAEGSGKSWTIETIDSQSLYYHASIALDDGDPKVSYYDSENSALKYAVRMTAPPSVQSLQASPGDGHVNLTWSPPSDTGGSEITRYNIYRGNSSEKMSIYDNVGAGTPSYTDDGLTNGETYEYQVSAVNSVGEGERSNQISATPSIDTDNKDGNLELMEKGLNIIQDYWWLFLGIVIVVIVTLLTGNSRRDTGTREGRTRRSESRETSVEEVSGERTTEEKLEELHEMKENRLISEEDFEEKKEKILEEY